MRICFPPSRLFPRLPGQDPVGDADAAIVDAANRLLRAIARPDAELLASLAVDEIIAPAHRGGGLKPRPTFPRPGPSLPWFACLRTFLTCQKARELEVFLHP